MQTHSAPCYTVIQMLDKAQSLIEAAQHVVVIQAENPDGDSLGSSVALEEILSDLGKQVSMYCPVDIPKYLRYIKGWDRVTGDFDTKADLRLLLIQAPMYYLAKPSKHLVCDTFLKRIPC